MPHWGFFELQNSVSELVVHSARNQSSERSRIVVEIYLPDILAESQNTVLIFQRAGNWYGRPTEIRLEGKPFGVVPLRFGLFRQIDHYNGTVHGGRPSSWLRALAKKSGGLLVETYALAGAFDQAVNLLDGTLVVSSFLR
jgi:hypothetical protein